MALAVNEASGLTPEALEVLRAELHARRLGNELRDVIDIQMRPIPPDEVDELVGRFRRLPCPLCGSVAGMLNAATVATAQSFLVMSTFEKRLVVGCSSCITAAADKADALTGALGWWAIPFGPVHTLQAMRLNARACSAAERQEATVELRQYVEANRGAVVLRLREAERPSERGGPTSGCG